MLFDDESNRRSSESCARILTFFFELSRYTTLDLANIGISPFPGYLWGRTRVVENEPETRYSAIAHIYHHTLRDMYVICEPQPPDLNLVLQRPTEGSSEGAPPILTQCLKRHTLDMRLVYPTPASRSEVIHSKYSLPQQDEMVTDEKVSAVL